MNFVVNLNGIRNHNTAGAKVVLQLCRLLTNTSIATYTVWDKYAVSVIYVSPILLDLGVF